MFEDKPIRQAGEKSEIYQAARSGSAGLSPQALIDILSHFTAA
ncbi:MAG TPA: hypothetical protein VGI46_11530 [Candidatus Acidoferrum sp.]|jgi:hypothetical protein